LTRRRSLLRSRSCGLGNGRIEHVATADATHFVLSRTGGEEHSASKSD
jgi:hypothetical protein